MGFIKYFGGDAEVLPRIRHLLPVGGGFDTIELPIEGIKILVCTGKEGEE